MSQRWRESVWLHCEKGFRRIKGFAAITEVIAMVEAAQEHENKLKSAT